MGTTSAAATRRMRVKANRQQIADAIRHGLKPRTIVGTLPAGSRRLYQPLAKHGITLVDVRALSTTGKNNPHRAVVILAVVSGSHSTAKGDAKTAKAEAAFREVVHRAGFDWIENKIFDLVGGGVYFVCAATDVSRELVNG